MDRPQTTTWFFNDKADTEMFCGHCVKDNQVWMYMPAARIAELEQEAVCYYCGWCPKKEGNIRPNHRSRQ